MCYILSILLLLLFYLRVMHSTSVLQDSLVHTKGQLMIELGFGRTEELWLITDTLALAVYDMLALEGVWLILTLYDVLRDADVMLTDIVVILMGSVIYSVMLHSMEDVTFPSKWENKYNVFKSRKKIVVECRNHCSSSLRADLDGATLSHVACLWQAFLISQTHNLLTIIVHDTKNVTGF